VSLDVGLDIIHTPAEHTALVERLRTGIDNARDVRARTDHPFDGKHASDDDTDRSDNGYNPQRVNEHQQVERRYITVGGRWRAYTVAV
jgi:hypothetical protein